MKVKKRKPAGVVKRSSTTRPALVWDKWNREHIKKHKVTALEVEEVYIRATVSLKAKMGREEIVAKTSTKRIIAIFLSFERQIGPYVVSARDANKKERRKYYEKTKTNTTL